MRKMLVLALVAVPAMVFAVHTSLQPAPRPQPVPTDFPEKTKMPPVQLTDPDSPFFSQQLIKSNGKVKEMHVTYRDLRRAKFIFNANERLEHVTVYHPDTETRIDTKSFEAAYDQAGVRITWWKRWRPDSTLEKSVERKSDSEVYTFYNDEGVRVQSVDVMTSGMRTTTNYPTDGSVALRQTAPAMPEEIVLANRTVNGQVIPRLTLHLKGAHIAGWTHVGKDGKVDHTAEFLADGSLLFSFTKEGKLARQQRYEVVGEDWQRQYYRLRESKVYFPDGKTVNHLVTMHPNGMQKEHRRYDDKGRMEAIRNFTPTMRQIRMEEFDVATGKPKGLWEWSADNASRGFVPDGVKGDPDDGDPEGSIYDFGDVPYMEKGKTYTNHPLFRVK